MKITSSRQLERKIVEDLPLRYLAGGQRPDFWTLNAFRRRHRRGLNDVFTHVLELARDLKLTQLGRVAVDSTRVEANASKERVDSAANLRSKRARARLEVRRWQRRCEAEDAAERPAPQVAQAAVQRLEEQRAAIPGRLRELKKSGLERRSRTDPDSRFQHGRGGSRLGYRADLAVNESRLVVAQRVTQNTTDTESLRPMVEAVQQNCGQLPEQVLADAGFFSADNLHAMKAQQVDAYIPDSVLAQEMKPGKRVRGAAKIKDAEIQAMRRKLRSWRGSQIYRLRREWVEPIMGILKEVLGMRRFRLRGRDKVQTEFTWATSAYNLGRIFRIAGPHWAQSFKQIGWAV